MAGESAINPSGQFRFAPNTTPAIGNALSGFFGARDLALSVGGLAGDINTQIGRTISGAQATIPLLERLQNINVAELLEVQKAREAAGVNKFFEFSTDDQGKVQVQVVPGPTSQTISPIPINNVSPVNRNTNTSGGGAVSSPFDLGGLNFNFAEGAPSSFPGGGSLGGLLGDILGEVPVIGGVLGPLGNVLGGVLDTAGGVIGGIIGGGSGGQQGGSLGGLLGGLLGGGGSGSAGSTSGGGIGQLAGPALILGLSRLLGGTSLGENRQEFRVNLPPPTPEELELLGINIGLAREQLQAFQQAQGSQSTQTEFIERLFSGQNLQERAEDIRSQSRFGGTFDSAIGFQNVERLLRETGLVGQEFEIQKAIQDDFLRGNVASPEDLERIRASSNLAVETGLSDLAKFQEDTLDRIRLSAAGRGLRPSDTPILTGFEDVAEESGRQAEQLIRGIRQRQLESELAFPLARGQLGLGQFQAQSSALGNRRQFEQDALRASQQNRSGLANTATGLGLGLATGGGAGSTLGGLQQTRAAGRNTTNVNQANPLTTGATIGSLFGL